MIDRPLIPQFESIVQIATSFDDYSILVELVERAGLVDVLTNDGPFTVFAPNNNAFHRLMDELYIELDDLLTLGPLLKEILLYHLVPQRLTVDELGYGDLETVNGQNVDILPYELAVSGFAVEGLKVADAQQRKIDVIIGNVLAANGVVNVVEEVWKMP